MKAKHFKKIRETHKYYIVEETSSLFGEFKYNWEYAEVVLAKNPVHACRRAKRRGYGRNHPTESYTTENWARFRVKELGKSDHFRNISYIGI